MRFFLLLVFILNISISVSCTKNSNKNDGEKEYKYLSYSADVKVGQDTLYVDTSITPPDTLLIKTDNDLDAFRQIYIMHCIDVMKSSLQERNDDSMQIHWKKELFNDKGIDLIKDYSIEKLNLEKTVWEEERLRFLESSDLTFEDSLFLIKMFYPELMTTNYRIEEITHNGKGEKYKITLKHIPNYKLIDSGSTVETIIRGETVVLPSDSRTTDIFADNDRDAYLDAYYYVCLDYLIKRMVDEYTVKFSDRAYKLINKEGKNILPSIDFSDRIRKEEEIWQSVKGDKVYKGIDMDTVPRPVINTFE